MSLNHSLFGSWYEGKEAMKKSCPLKLGRNWSMEKAHSPTFSSSDLYDMPTRWTVPVIWAWGGRVAKLQGHVGGADPFPLDSSPSALSTMG